MDGPLSSSRQVDRGSGGSSRYGPYGSDLPPQRGGRHHRSRGRGGRRSGGRGGRYHPHYNNRGGGGGGGNHNHYPQPRQNSSFRRGGGGRPGNRFQSSAPDPEAEMAKNLAAMVAKMGDWSSNAAALETTGDLGHREEEVTSADAGTDAPVDTTHALRDLRTRLRGVLAKNVRDAATVLSVGAESGNASFLRFRQATGTGTGTSTGTGTVTEEARAGPLATLVVACAYALPLQTSSCAALTCAVETRVGASSSYAGFARRCVRSACARLRTDLSLSAGYTSTNIDPDSVRRAKLLLRYLALLYKAGVLVGRAEDLPAVVEATGDGSTATGMEGVEGTNGNSQNDHVADHNPHQTNTQTDTNHEKPMGLYDLLVHMVTVARDISEVNDESNHGTSSSSSSSRKIWAHVLSYLVLSTVPYLLDVGPMDVLQSLVEDIAAIIKRTYRSPFRPGEGILAILLKNPPNDGEEEEDDDDDDEDPEEVEAEPCCDSLQELLRATQTLINDPSQGMYGTLTEAPWKEDMTEESTATPDETTSKAIKMEEDGNHKEGQASGTTTTEAETTDAGSANNANEEMRTVAKVVPISLPFLPMDPSLGSTTEYDKNVNMASVSSTILPPPVHPLSEVCYARLPIFATSEDDEEDDDDDDDDNMKGGLVKPQTPYVTNYSPTARTLLYEAVRDVMACHRPTLSSSGLARGSCRDVADHLLSLKHMFAAEGVEFGIVECLLGMLVTLSQSSTRTHAHTTYVWRTLWELTIARPTVVAPATVAMVATVLHEEDLLSSLTPDAARRTSEWLSFHLVNTDFQWPQAYWEHWATNYVETTRPRPTERAFLRTLLQCMVGLAGTDVVLERCLPSGSALASLLTSSPNDNDNENVDSNGNAMGMSTTLPPPNELELELRQKIWVEKDPAASIDEWLAEYEESFFADRPDDSRCRMVVRAILSAGISPPPGNHNGDNDDNRNNDEGHDPMAEDDDDGGGGNSGGNAGGSDHQDLLDDLKDFTKRYAPLLISCMKGRHRRNLPSDDDNEDAQNNHQEDNDYDAEAAVLSQLQQSLPLVLGPSIVSMETLQICLLETKVVTPLGLLRFVVQRCHRDRDWHLSATLATSYAVSNAIASYVPDDDDDDVNSMEEDDRDPGEGSSNMTARDATQPHQRLFERVAEALEPLLVYATVRVCEDLAPSNTTPSTSAALSSSSSAQVPITTYTVWAVEGLKRLLWKAQTEALYNLRSYLDENERKHTGTSAAHPSLSTSTSTSATVTDVLVASVGGERLAREATVATNGNGSPAAVVVEAHVLPWMANLPL